MDKQKESYNKQKFNAEHYSRVHADLPKDLVARFKTEVKTRGETIAEVLRQAMERYLNPDTEK